MDGASGVHWGVEFSFADEEGEGAHVGGVWVGEEDGIDGGEDVEDGLEGGSVVGRVPAAIEQDCKVLDL